MSRRLFDRDAGVLLHPTSLPGPHGIGDLGPTAHAWLDRLAAADQTLWQVLPLHPVRRAGSPYTARSTHAGNPLLISPDALVDDGLLTADDLTVDRPRDGAIDFAAVAERKAALLDIAMMRFASGADTASLRDAFAGFVARESANWLTDYALYAALQEQFHGAAWTSWPAPFRDRDAATLRTASRELDATIQRIAFEQFLFDRQWRALRDAATRRGIRIVGDLPIFVAPDSADVWAHRELFQLDADGAPRVVAGVPPDYFSATGQLWGNPLYAWERHAADGFAWWRRRVERLLELVDVVRIDHFRGFAAYWEVPAGNETAIDGRWVEAPGRDLFTVLERELGRPLPLIAEDLGRITADVVALRDEFELPGLRVLQFAFGDDPTARTFLPAAYVPNCVAYTGTHDNDTLVGWLCGKLNAASTRSADDIAAERAAIERELGIDPAAPDAHWRMIEAVYASAAGAAIVPLQDVLGLGSDARMNVPGQPEGNWTWRLASLDDLDAPLRRLAAICSTANRRRPRPRPRRRSATDPTAETP